MAKKYKLDIDANLSIDQVKRAIGEVQQSLKKLSIPKNIADKFEKSIDKVNRDILNVSDLNNQKINSVQDMKALERAVKSMSKHFNELLNQYQQISGLSDDEIEKLFPKDFSDRINKATNALKEYNKASKQNESNIGTQKKRQDSLQKKIAETEEKITKAQNKQSQEKFKETNPEYAAKEKELEKLKQQQESYLEYISKNKRKDATAEVVKNSIDAEVEEAERLYSEAVEAYNRLDKSRKQAEEKIANLQKKKEELEKSKPNKENLDNETSSIQQDISSLKKSAGIQKGLITRYNHYRESDKVKGARQLKDKLLQAEASGNTKNIEDVKAEIKEFKSKEDNQEQWGLLEQYDKKISKAEAELKRINSQIENAENKIKKLQENYKNEIEKIDGKIKQNDKKITEEEEKLEGKKSKVDENSKASKDLKKAEERRDKAKEAQQNFNAEDYNKIVDEIKSAQSELDSLLKSSNTYTSDAAKTKAIDELKDKLETFKRDLAEVEAELVQLDEVGSTDFKKLREDIAKAFEIDVSEIPQTKEEIEELIKSMSADQINRFRQAMNEFGNTVDKAGGKIQKISDEADDLHDKVNKFDNQMGNVDNIKKRIQAFFALENSIELFKRAIRSAYETVKELDAAMTETAVVTDFSVNDMWEQLPEYTARANELGITTLDAYEASTLFYQQGLETNEVMALSNETLKMARIAGLDAADATDRMTNALRGFNMELTEANAQRVNDVYSELAAKTASNVDEISTAMTKVASLASSANMEFETTSAFLAQIIETTRESA